MTDLGLQHGMWIRQRQVSRAGALRTATLGTCLCHALDTRMQQATSNMLIPHAIMAVPVSVLTRGRPGFICPIQQANNMSDSIRSRVCVLLPQIQSTSNHMASQRHVCGNVVQGVHLGPAYACCPHKELKKSIATPARPMRNINVASHTACIHPS